MSRRGWVMAATILALAGAACYRSAAELDGGEECGAGVDACPDGDGGDAIVRICDPAELEAALARARPGEAVRVGDCRIVGSFTVPAGVTLAGEGGHASTIVTGDLRLRRCD